MTAKAAERPAEHRAPSGGGSPDH